jgi:bifunctional DNA-binding transcriptional regulator/antitoxin component of YhaV-PrlF toxin-antitoxin module
MPKLQEIVVKSTGQIYYSITIPIKIVKHFNWQKGQDLEFILQDSKLTLQESPWNNPNLSFDEP